MGYTAHDAVIVTANGYALRPGAGVPIPDVEAFRTSVPPELRGLVVGPIKSWVEDYVTWIFAPDGSKEGWPQDALADEWRAKFIALFAFRYEDGSTPFEMVHIRFGGDYAREHGATVEYQQREKDPELADAGLRLLAYSLTDEQVGDIAVASGWIGDTPEARAAYLAQED